jgi:hypothetical protein
MNHNKTITLLRPTCLYEEAERRYQEISKCRLELKTELEKAPSGIIHILKSGSRVQFYLRRDKSDRNGTYIRKSDTHTIRTFLRKSYLEKSLKLLNQEEKNLATLLKKTDHIADRIKELYSGLPAEAKQYITPIDLSDEDYAAQWLSESYEGKDIPDYVPFYETSRGERVRSKSELTIANMLADRGIPYKYECPLTLLGGVVIYPDFTLLDVKRRRDIYWEHRGMMDDRDYARQAVFKIKSLMKNEIILGDNLIITEETSANPLGTNEIEAIIDQFFGSGQILTRPKNQ